jgi:multiple sugar transport system permease protein
MSGSSTQALGRAATPNRSATRTRALASRRAWLLLIYGIVILAAVAAAFPFLYIVSLSFKESTSLVTYPPQWIPDPPYLGNYTQALFETRFPRWMLNTVIVAGGVTLIKLVIDSLAAYAFAKLDFPFKEPLFIFALSLLMVPLAATLIPMFLVVKGLGLLNTYPGLMLPGLASPLGIFLLRGFMGQLPRDLDNAARLDGASEPFILARIIIPLCRPALVALAIWLFLTQWTGYAWPLVATTSDDMRLLTNGLAGLKGQYVVNWGLIAAGTVLVLVPTIIAFLIFMRQFVAGSLAGALKQ